MGRALLPALLLLVALAGCVEVGAEKDMAAEEKPVEALKRLGSDDPALAAKLELDPSVQGTWWTHQGRWDDPSRRIGVDWGPLTLVVYPSSILDLPRVLYEIPAAILRAAVQPRESEKMDQLRRLAEEEAERHYPTDGRPPR